MVNSLGSFTICLLQSFIVFPEKFIISLAKLTYTFRQRWLSPFSPFTNETGNFRLSFRQQTENRQTSICTMSKR